MTASTLTGSLLVATPLLDEPPFRRSVILLLDHDDDGALGVVVNRAADLAVDRVLPNWSATVNELGVLFMGGPVGTDSALAVAEVIDWYVVQSEPDDVFGLHPDTLWRRVLRRQKDQMAYLATYPDDPTQN